MVIPKYMYAQLRSGHKLYNRTMGINVFITGINYPSGGLFTAGIDLSALLGDTSS